MMTRRKDMRTRRKLFTSKGSLHPSPDELEFANERAVESVIRGMMRHEYGHCFHVAFAKHDSVARTNLANKFGSGILRKKSGQCDDKRWSPSFGECFGLTPADVGPKDEFSQSSVPTKPQNWGRGESDMRQFNWNAGDVEGYARADAVEFVVNAGSERNCVSYARTCPMEGFAEMFSYVTSPDRDEDHLRGPAGTHMLEAFMQMAGWTAHNERVSGPAKLVMDLSLEPSCLQPPSVGGGGPSVRYDLADS